MSNSRNHSFSHVINYRGLSDYFASKIRTIVVGTSIKNISVEHLGDNLIAVPAAKVLEDYEQRMSFMVEKLGLLEQSSLELASLRDFLLPLLMNGQVKTAAMSPSSAKTCFAQELEEIDAG